MATSPRDLPFTQTQPVTLFQQAPGGLGTVPVQGLTYNPPVSGLNINSTPGLTYPNQQLQGSALAPQPQPSPAQNVQQAFSNIIKTGKSTPPPTTQPQMATLVNPKTGDRKAVGVGSQDAQALFGQGYVLETQAPSTTNTNTNINSQTTKTTNQQQTQATSRIPFLRGEADKVRQEAFTTVYGYTPDDWQNLSPDAQRRLRNQRVQGLAGQLGNLNSAIQQAQQEETAAKTETQKARENALDTLNTYLKYGVLDKLSPADKQTLASTAGFATDALDAIAKQSATKPVELKTLGADLYQVSYDENGQPSVKLLASGKSSGGGGGSVSGFIPSNNLNEITKYLTENRGEDGYTNTSIFRQLYAEVSSTLGANAAKEFLSRFPANAWLNPKDSTASVFFGSKPAGLKVESSGGLDSLIE